MIAPNAARYGLMVFGEARTLRGLVLLSTLKLAPAKALPIALFGVVCLLGTSPARAAPSPCEESAEIAVLPAPVSPWKGAPLHVLFTAEKPFTGELTLVAPDGSAVATTRNRHGGPPYFWFADVATPAGGYGTPNWCAMAPPANAPRSPATLW